ncbi:hypothetical protein OD350_09610 [Clostridium beijerinckii]|uniref:hypothetical protein n=2 Tax=Clostridium beijerinckii TaxID=1520 RepID=UPI0022272E2C|nr:hypothetical protein [Clostridium beijerinckii]UYZ37902.1 hypothetical protein OD350_09610 [Clostridium beijerinckii]
MLLLGIVTIASMISSNEAKQKQEHQEIIESISSDLEGSTTSIAINSAQDVIQELKDVSVFDSISGTIATEINDITADVNNSPAIPTPLIPPSIPDYGPIPNPLNPPDAGPTSPPSLVPPDDGPNNPPPLIPPTVASKGLEDYINWAKKNKTKNKDEGDIPPQRYVGSNEEKVKTSREGLNEHPEISKLARSRGAKNDDSNYLNDEEKKTANKLLDMLNNMRRAELDGDNATVGRIKDEFLNIWREHPLEREYDGWTSLDLNEENSFYNKYRLLYREVSDGIEWKIVRMHE